MRIEIGCESILLVGLLLVAAISRPADQPHARAGPIRHHRHIRGGQFHPRRRRRAHHRHVSASAKARAQALRRHLHLYFFVLNTIKLPSYYMADQFENSDFKLTAIFFP